MASPSWDGGGYGVSDYAQRAGDIVTWVQYVRDDSAAGLQLTVSTDLSGLSHRFAELGRLTAPPGSTDSWWASITSTLSDFASQASDEWGNGQQTAAMARFEVIIQHAREILTAVDRAFGLALAIP